MKNENFSKTSCVNKHRRLLLKCSVAGFLGSCFGLHNAFSAVTQAAGTVLNVKDFGALGDGQHDDSPAFQQACDRAKALGGAKIYVPDPSVHYRLLFPVYLASHTEMYGQGQSTKIIFEDPLFIKGRGGFVIGSSQEANSGFAHHWYLNKQKATTINPGFRNPAQRQYLRDNPQFLQAENTTIHDLYLVAQFTPSRKGGWGGYGINFVNAQNCHAYSIWGSGWTQLIGMGSDVPPETPSNHQCSARNLTVLSPDLTQTYYSIGFMANSTNCVIENAVQEKAMTAGSLNGSGVATNLCEDCTIKNIRIPDLGRTATSEGVLINNSSGCRVENIFIANAKTAVSVFYTLPETLNPKKPNIFNKIEGDNCDVILAIYSKFNIIKDISGKNSRLHILLKNSNATDNSIFAPPDNVTLSGSLAHKLFSNKTFISSQLK